MYKMKAFLWFLTILLAIGSLNCDPPDAKDLEDTHIGAAEKIIQALIKRKEIIDRKWFDIKEGLKSVSDRLPALRYDSKAMKQSIGDYLNPLKYEIKAIFPGTYWCGDGNISPNGRDVNVFKKTDACCKAHDSCPDNIPEGGSQDGLVNNGLFTRSACSCDGAFYHCLKEVKNIIASSIGTTYFNILRPQCFQKYYPIRGCKRYTRQSTESGKCEEYSYNFTLPMKMQWFDNPNYFHI